MNHWQKILDTDPSPLQELHEECWKEKGVRLFIKRDDLLAPAANDPFCGNKWRKLKYNLLFAKESNISTVLSFGGAYSNHIAALASAGRLFNIQTIGIIRGEEVRNPTIDRARKDGMQLHFIDRTTYRKKGEEGFLAELEDEFGPCYIIPEGGTNQLALKGAAEMAMEIQAQCDSLTHIAVACGTGGTISGIIQGIEGKQKALGISVLKGNFMTSEVASLLHRYVGQNSINWEVLEGFHHGGYARKGAELLTFIKLFREKHGIQLEPIYTGKLFYALEQLLQEGYFSEGSSIVAVHTGGLQGLGK